MLSALAFDSIVRVLFILITVQVTNGTGPVRDAFREAT